MASPSLLQRLNIPPPTTTGPIRAKGQSSSRRNSPYNRTSKADVDSQWSHDLYEEKSLSERLSSRPVPLKANLNAIAKRAIRDATTSHNEPLSIKGASTANQGNVVDVTGLVSGTTAEDVVAIFKRCGAITTAKTIHDNGEVKIRVTFKAASSAAAAVHKFNNQPADGKILSVQIVGSTSIGATLGGRLGGVDGLDLVREEGSVDVLMASQSPSHSKLRSDSLIQANPRAQVMVAPPGANPVDYLPAPSNNRGGARRGRGGRGAKRGGRGVTARMDID